MFKIGDLVQVVDHPNFVSGREYIGHIGKIIESVGDGFLCWRVQGVGMIAYGTNLIFTEKALRKVDPPADFTPAITEDWDLTYWKPPVREKV